MGLLVSSPVAATHHRWHTHCNLFGCASDPPPDALESCSRDATGTQCMRPRRRLPRLALVAIAGAALANLPVRAGAEPRGHHSGAHSVGADGLASPAAMGPVSPQAWQCDMTCDMTEQPTNGEQLSWWQQVWLGLRTSWLQGPQAAAPPTAHRAGPTTTVAPVTTGPSLRAARALTPPVRVTRCSLSSTMALRGDFIRMRPPRCWVDCASGLLCCCNFWLVPRTRL